MHSAASALRVLKTVLALRLLTAEMRSFTVLRGLV